MTKKRFIKLLMSHGESIHSARVIAFLYNANNIPYKKAYYEYLIRCGLKNAFSQLTKTMVKLGESFKTIGKSLEKLTEVMNNTSEKSTVEMLEAILKSEDTK